jgi:hypothetical protein
MNNQPSLIQELETAKILQELSQGSAVENPTKPPKALSGQIKKRSTLLKKRKLSATTENYLVGLTQSRGIANSPVSDYRPISPSTTDYDSTDGSSLGGSLPLDDSAPFKPLFAPPKLRRVSFQPTERPTDSVSTIHRSPVSKKATVSTTNSLLMPKPTLTYSQTISPIIEKEEVKAQVATKNAPLIPKPMSTFSQAVHNNIPPPLNHAAYRTMLQVLGDPMCTTVPMCSFVSTPAIDQTTVNILPKIPVAVSASIPCIDSSEKIKKKRKVCRMDDCNEDAARRTPYCKKHCGQRKCEHDGCNKCAQGRTRFCIGHGGGRRCQHEGCTKGARDKHFCASHGGGRRCNVASCSKLAVGKGRTCTAHGGGRRCQHESCSKSAQSSSDFW